MKLLISDPVSDAARKYLENNGVSFDYQQKISPQELLTQINRYDGLLVRSRTKVTRGVITHGTNLKIIGRVGSGYDNIDIDSCRKKNIAVINAPNANSQAVAEMTVALMLCLLRRLDRAFDSMKKGLWEKKSLVGNELSGKTVGLVGYGHIGKKVAELVRAFGAKVEYFSRREKSVKLEELFAESDIVSVHVALTPETKGLVNMNLLTKMKPSAFFLNISRGEAADSDALYQVLIQGKIKGAALDVYSDEPLSPESRWRNLPNVILTPHIGAATVEALEKASMVVVEDIVRFVKGEKLENQVI